MTGFTEIPLLAGLSKVEFAKLLADVHELKLTAGAVVEDPGELAQWYYLISDGQLELVALVQDQDVAVISLNAGDVAGEFILPKSESFPRQLRAVTDVTLYRIPRARLQRLIRSDSRLSDSFDRMLTAQLATVLHELTRIKVILAAYADAVWEDVAPPSLEQASAAISETPAVTDGRKLRGSKAAKASGESKKPKSVIWRWAGGLSSVVLGAAIFLLHGGSYQLAAVTAILTAAAWNWLLQIVPEYVVGLATITLLAATGAVSPEAALTGFASPTWFLLFSVLGIGVAVSRSGLLYRLALHMLRLLPPSYAGQTFALALTGVLFTPLLPSLNSRSAIASPLARELSEAMRFPERGKGSAGLAMSSFLGFGLMYFPFLNGTSICMVAWSLLPAAIRQQVTWGWWLWVALPLGLLVFAGSYAAILLMYPAEATAGVSRDTIRAQLQVLGRMTGTERITLWVLGAVLIGFVTQGIHGIDPAWLGLSGLLVLVGSGVLDKDALKGIDWSFLLLFGALVGISGIIKASGLSKELSAVIQPLFQPLGASPYLFLGAVALLTVLVSLVVTGQQAVLVMVIALLPVATQMGYHPLTIALVVLAMASSWLFPYQNPGYLTVYSGTEGKSFTHVQVRPLAIVQMMIMVAAVLASVPFWQFLGLIPR